MGIFNRWRNKQVQEQRDKGFAYAACRLIKGESPVNIESKAEYGENFEGKKDFDYGIREAIQAWYEWHRS